MVSPELVNVDGQLRDLKLQGKLILQIHDELILDVPKEEIDMSRIMVKGEMEASLDLAVPLTVNISVSDNLAKS